MCRLFEIDNRTISIESTWFVLARRLLEMWLLWLPARGSWLNSLYQSEFNFMPTRLFEVNDTCAIAKPIPLICRFVDFLSIDCSAQRAIVLRAAKWYQLSRWWCVPKVMSTTWNALRVNSVPTGQWCERSRSSPMRSKILNRIEFSTDFAWAIDFICAKIKFYVNMITRSV